MIILPCGIKNFNVKDSEIIVSIVISSSHIEEDPDKIKKLFTLKNSKLSIALAPEAKKDTLKSKLNQLDFILKCPDCGGYDCVAGEAIAVCNACKKEFYKYREDAIEDKRMDAEQMTFATKCLMALQKAGIDHLAWLEKITGRKVENLYDELGFITQREFRRICERYNETMKSLESEKGR